jgi:hypothetical protein
MKKVELPMVPYSRSELLEVRDKVASTIFRKCRHIHEKGIAALVHPGDDDAFLKMVNNCLCADNEEVGNCAHRVEKRRANPFLLEAEWLADKGLLPREEVMQCNDDAMTIYDTDVEVNMVHQRVALNISLVSDQQTMTKAAEDQDAMIEKLEARQTHFVAIIDSALASLPAASE